MTAIRYQSRYQTRLQLSASRYYATPGEVAITWTLYKPPVTGADVGVRSAQQFGGIGGTIDIELSREDMRMIEHEFNSVRATKRLRT